MTAADSGYHDLLAVPLQGASYHHASWGGAA
jgi:hypothetical protein